VFHFRLGRGRDGPKEFLGQFEGILQTDGYVAYDRVGGPKIVHACCWAHARRKFFEAAKLNPSDVAATRMVARIDDLFGIDAQARELNLDHAARHALRLERAKPLLEVIREEVEAARDACLPSSALGKAANYTLSLWRKLTRFLEYPELELSNNLAENSMRPVALGRNYVHSRIMCSRPDSGWRASLAKRGFAGLAHATWTKLIGTDRLSIIKASAGTLERGQLADTGTA
jgi:hypothetical protein